MRNTFADTFFEAAQADERLCTVVADISPAGSMSRFREKFPRRFINTGVAEQIMIGIAAGMALRGLKPFAYTIATFSIFRPYEFVRDDLCYQNLPVTVVGIGGGVTYSTLGATHHALEDVALATTLPNMQVIAPCDPAEVRAATLWCVAQTNGPVYLRLGKAGEPVLTRDAAPWEFGKLRYLRHGGDICLLAYGPVTRIACEAADRLEAQGAKVSVVSVHTLKPLDEAGIRDALARHRRVAVVEEMLPHGGLAGRVKEIAWETQARCRIDAFTLGDEFMHLYGSHEELLASAGLSAEAIAARLGRA
ncbi:MAG TPA: transketolase C-terminal domain-containing protein [Stellaceae bacterium]|nr:transketolase C-terminal domain-containing protein [Stellaceae bacterium]